MKKTEISNELLKARDEYIEQIKAELMGPGSEFSYPDKEHELISSNPLRRYVSGILFPQGNIIGKDNDENLTEESDEETTIVEFEEIENEQGEIKETKNDKAVEFDETASETFDEEIGLATQYKPSSLGFTFLAKGNTDKLYCNATFATYRRATMEDCVVPAEVERPDLYRVPDELSHIMAYDSEKKLFRLISGVNQKELRSIFERDTLPEAEVPILKNCVYRLADFLRTGYVRVPHAVNNIEISFENSDYYDGLNSSHLDDTNAKVVALRTRINDDIWSVTIMLINDIKAVPEQVKDCLFQPVLDIDSEKNFFCFISNPETMNADSVQDEEMSLELLYRHKKSYGTGLGVSVDWSINEYGIGRLWSDYFPVKEIPSMSFSLPENDMITDEELSMKYLSDLGKSSKLEKLSSLRKLVDLYSQWIKNLKKDFQTLTGEFQKTAERHISECEKAAERMYNGIKILGENNNAYDAFVLANRAMFMQRIHIKKQNEMARKNADRYPDDDEISEWLTTLNYNDEAGERCRWRPFQLAFLIMDICSIVFDNSEERKLVDLIWFPTGGGKTEAYLGLTAFTIFYRRLTYENSAAGTTVMMRYTLRLLAAQQFTRAATLICACEYIRQDSLKKRSIYPTYKLGKEQISIGLWIGGTHTPNKNKGDRNSAEVHLDKLMKVSSHSYVNTEKDRHNKFQVLKCPWCGTKMVKDDGGNKLVGEWGYAMNGSRFYMFCPHEDCDFTKRLPIQIIDEELYDNPPTLLFGTVDKFAMMAWDGRTSAFFATNSENRGPELIIQDELHLISGALGTMVGLYETAIDGLAGMKGVFPKVIASTATIRRAKEQCSVLYNRNVVQFPAPGLDAADSFFAREDEIDYSKGAFGRKYVGLLPSGQSKAMMEVRAMAAMLQIIMSMELTDEVKDKLWTLTVYFNSLKDLGKASSLVDDDVKDFIIRKANRMFTKRRIIVNSDELTSRVSTTRLNETLDKLEKIEYSKENIEKKDYASNILLATNMISVGIDVARLNVMLMVGQPKLTSEYIQASSRIGRTYPGVAFIQYDSTKSRDRSHYEGFKAYHESFYRFVEPTGATPFSKPARGRALHSVMVTLLRNRLAMGDDNAADWFDKETFGKEIAETEDFILSRVSEINRRAVHESKDDLDDIKNEMEEFIDFWQKQVEKCHASGESSLAFGRKYMVKPPIDGEYRLLKQFESPGKDDARETLTSMRNVDAPVLGNVVIWED